MIPIHEGIHWYKNHSNRFLISLDGWISWIYFFFWIPSMLENLQEPQKNKMTQYHQNQLCRRLRLTTVSREVGESQRRKFSWGRAMHNGRSEAHQRRCDGVHRGRRSGWRRPRCRAAKAADESDSSHPTMVESIRPPTSTTLCGRSTLTSLVPLLWLLIPLTPIFHCSPSPVTFIQYM